MATVDMITETIARSNSSALTRLDEQRLFRRLNAGDASARDQIFEHNVKLAAKFMHAYESRGVARDDLFQEACMGLLHAIDKFDLSYGTKFSTYAIWWIKQHCQRAVQNQGRSLRLPVHVQEKLARMWRAEAKLHAQLGREVTPLEIAQELGETEEYVRHLLVAQVPTYSLNYRSEEGSEFGDSIVDLNDPFAEVEERLVNQMTASVLYDLMDLVLEPRQREILVRHWGLEGHQPETLEQIGDSLSISRERVRQIQENAMTALKRPRLRTTLNWTAAGVVRPQKRRKKRKLRSTASSRMSR